MDFKEIEKLIELLEQSSLSELEIEEDDRRIRLTKAAPAPVATMIAAPQAAAAPIAEAAPVAAAAPAPAPAAEPEEEEHAHTINSPMVGTYYSSPAPGEPTFITVGDRVEADQTVCIVEAMKIMNEVAAKEPCIIEQILVENGDPVEFGQPLFAIKPLS